MRKIFSCLIIILMILAFTGCGNEKVQTVPLDQKQEPSVLVSADKSVKLPKGYPSEKFPLFEGSFISAVIELDGVYTLTAFSKDEVKKVIDFYAKVLNGEKDAMETKTDESLTSFGTKDGYTYSIDVGMSSEMEGYRTSITIVLQPIR